MSKQKSEYIYIQPQIVGNLDKWDMAYYSDLHPCPSVGAAMRHGLRVLDHDDFWVGEKQGGSIVRLYSSNGILREHEDLQEELDGVNSEFGFKPVTLAAA